MIRLRELRESAKLTQEDVGKIIGITRAAYTNIENSKREPDYKTLCTLADYYGVTTDYIFERTDIIYFQNYNLSSDAYEVAKAYDVAKEGTKESVRKLLDIPEYKKGNDIAKKVG